MWNAQHLLGGVGMAINPLQDAKSAGALARLACSGDRPELGALRAGCGMAGASQCLRTPL